MRKILKRSLCILLSLFLSVGSINVIIPDEKVYAYGMTAAATNDYTTWKQTSSSWGEARPWPNASIPKFGDAGCWITSVAILLRHYNVVTDSNVNSFNPLICNNRLMQYGIVNSAGDFCNLGNMKNAYPGFEYVGQRTYSLNNLKSLYDQGYACIVHETRGHYVAVRSVSSSGAVVMDPGYSTTSLTNSDTIQYYKVTAKQDTVNPTIEDVYVKDVSASGYTVHCVVRDDQALGYVRFPTWTNPNDQDDIIWGTAGEIAGKGWELNYRVNVSDHNNEVNCVYVTHIYCYDVAGNVTSCAVKPVFVENIPPVISDVQITDISENGYTISCVVDDEHSGVNRVQFPTWCGDDNPYANDGSWHTSEFCKGKLVNGRYTYRVNISYYGNRLGKYTTHIYAWDESGNQSKGYATETIIKKTHKHEYTSSIKKAATCTTPGIMLYTCKDNDDSYEETIPATGHQHTELRNVKSATCGREGYTGDTYCKDCNTKLSSGKSIAKKTHTWDAGKVTKGATCSAVGVKTYTCTVCKATKTESIAATGHQHTELRNVKSATCGQEGYTGDTFCKDCNTKLSSGKSIAKKAHTWDAGKITQKATCIAKGVKIFTCTVCQTTKTEEIPATGHGTRIIKFAKNASCKTEGYTGDIYCQDCGILLEEGEIIQKTEHAWNDGKVTQDATCTEKGVKTYTCTVCQATKTEEIPATGHGKTEVRNQKDATCKAEGYTGDSYCTVCNQKICAGKKIAKIAHSWDKGKITRQPTTAKTGIKTYTCTKCKTTRTETVAKLKQKTLAVGKIIKDKASNGVYKVLKGGLSVEFTKPITKKASVKIPDTIKAGGVICKVTGISANAFKSNSSLKTISIGKNVTTIGNNAFYGCKKLNKITGGNSIAKIGEKAFANCGSLSSVTIAGSVRSIGKQAFYNCKKLKSIVVKTVALTDKNIGAKAFSGTYAKPTVKVPAKQLKAYQKLLRSKGMSSKAKYVRFQISVFYKASGNYF